MKENKYDGSECVEIIVISYPWITPQHPDPNGFHLHLVAQTIEMFLRFENNYYETEDYEETTEEEKLAFDQKEKKVKVAVFWDWMSCYQNYFPNTSSPPDSYEHLTDADKIMRTKKQDLCFKNALKSMNDWYVSKRTYSSGA